MDQFEQQMQLEWTNVKDSSDQHRAFTGADGLWARFAVLSEACSVERGERGAETELREEK